MAAVRVQLGTQLLVLADGSTRGRDAADGADRRGGGR